MDSGPRTKTKLHTKFHRNPLSTLEDYAGTDRQTDRQTDGRTDEPELSDHPSVLNASRNLYMILQQHCARVGRVGINLRSN